MLLKVCSIAAFAVAGLSAQRLTFDVQTVKPANPDAQIAGIKPLPGGQEYDATNLPVKLMISLMYKIPVRQITGGPGWLESERFDVRAKAEKPSTIEDLHIMFQNLIADEFQLKFHRETREGPVYALMVDKSGVKMKVNASKPSFDIPISRGRGGEFTGTRVAMDYLAWTLSQIVQRDGRPVIDKTGLSGNYDFTLAFAPELPPGVDPKNLPPGLMDHPDLFNALKEQLGLKLEPQKGPVEFFVIDSAVKPVGK